MPATEADPTGGVLFGLTLLAAAGVAGFELTARVPPPLRTAALCWLAGACGVVACAAVPAGGSAGLSLAKLLGLVAAGAGAAAAAGGLAVALRLAADAKPAAEPAAEPAAVDGE